VAEPHVVPLTDEVLAAHELPPLGRFADKQERGHVLVVAGSAHTPGAAILAGLAALRAGAGKLQILTAASVAVPVAVAVPEALVLGQRETERDGLDPELDRDARESVQQADAVLIGPGLLGEAQDVRDLVRGLLAQVDGATVIVDAAALLPLADDDDLLASCDGRAVLTPNPAELATVLGQRPEPGAEPAADSVREAALRFRAAIACGSLAGDAELLTQVPGGGPGLGTSGSGDVLAGIVAGLSARGAPPRAAAIWGAHLHARAGDRLAERSGPVGFLARELPGEIPAELAACRVRLQGT
jgi:ADP-dependent NAD(P)H-hydrate dehydratase